MPVREQYTLRLLFADSSGSYLADIAVTVADRAGNTLLEAISDGPYLWARLPPGSYRVTARRRPDRSRSPLRARQTPHSLGHRRAKSSVMTGRAFSGHSASRR